MHSTSTPLVERILVLGKGDGASLPYLDLPVGDLCAWKVEKIHSSSGGGHDQEISDILYWVVTIDVSEPIWILDLINHGKDHSAQEHPGLIMLRRRNAVEVWHVARIEKRGGDLFLHNLDTLKVSYVTTSAKLHTVKSNKEVHQKQSTRNTKTKHTQHGRDPETAAHEQLVTSLACRVFCKICAPPRRFFTFIDRQLPASASGSS